MNTLQESELAQVIQTSAAEVLETMFFTSVMEEPEPEPTEPLISSSLMFQGHPSGTFQVDMAQDAARSLAADFLGADLDEVSPEKGAEVVCELANMLCGSILSRIEPDGHFDLSHPEPIARLVQGSAVSQSLYLPAGTLRVSIRLGEVP